MKWDNHRVMPDGHRAYYCNYPGWVNYVRDYHRLTLEAFDKAMK